MAITAELIKQQEIDTPFTDSQIALVEKLSRNEEEQVIHNKRGDWYKQFDQTILDESGIPKEGQEKASDYAKRVLAAQKAKIAEMETYKTKAATLEAKIATLEEGKGDAATTQKIKDLQSELASLKETHQQELQAKESALTEKEKALISEKTETQFAAALSSVNFKKDEQSTAVKDILISNAKQALLAEATMSVEEGKVIWRDKKGEIIRNPKNGNEPMTTAELLMPKLAPVIDLGRKATGTGTTAAQGGQSSSTGFNPTAKTKTDFYTQASDHLVALGVDRTTPEFAAKLSELSKEFNAQELPVA
jgi:hypothetical protein